MQRMWIKIYLGYQTIWGFLNLLRLSVKAAVYLLCISGLDDTEDRVILELYHHTLR